MPSQDLQYNILLTNETPPRACLADFGLSTLTPGGPRDAETVTVGGTPIYMAPELLSPIRFGKSSSRPTQPADIYAFGMVIYEVLTGFQPFHEQKRGLFDLTYHIAHGLRPARPDNVEQVGFGDGTWELVEECWMGEATRRPTIEQVLAHLKCVAAFSMVVDPTPEIPHESIENSRGFDSCSKLFISPTRGSSHLRAQGQIQLFMSTVATVQLPTDPVNLANRDTTVATVDAGSPARSLRSTVSRTARSASPVSGKKTPPSKARPFNTIPAVRPGSKTSVGIMLVSAALSSMILVPSKDDKTRIRLPGSTRAITRRRKVSNTPMHHHVHRIIPHNLFRPLQPSRISQDSGKRNSQISCVCVRLGTSPVREGKHKDLQISLMRCVFWKSTISGPLTTHLDSR